MRKTFPNCTVKNLNKKAQYASRKVKKRQKITVLEFLSLTGTSLFLNVRTVLQNKEFHCTKNNF